MLHNVKKDENQNADKKRAIPSPSLGVQKSRMGWVLFVIVGDFFHHRA